MGMLMAPAGESPVVKESNRRPIPSMLVDGLGMSTAVERSENWILSAAWAEGTAMRAEASVVTAAAIERPPKVGCECFWFNTMYFSAATLSFNFDNRRRNLFNKKALKWPRSAHWPGWVQPFLERTS